MKLEGCDWEEVFKSDYATPTSADPNCKTSVEAFTLQDVDEVLHAQDGERDETDWIAVFRLKDGRFGCIRAWCDYTGWG